MKSIFIFAIIAMIAACVPDNYPVTFPKGSTLCHSDYDCLRGGYCGFMPGYTAAVCRSEGSATDTWSSPTATGFKFNSR